MIMVIMNESFVPERLVIIHAVSTYVRAIIS